MKKTLLATAILAGLVSATAQSATVYDQDGTTLKIGGRAEVRAEFKDTGDGSVEDKSRARINFGGKTQITDNLTGFGFMEYQIEPGETVDNRYLFAGFGTSIGDFSYGRQDTANVQVSDMTDIASVHSGYQQVFDASSDKENTTFLYSGTFADSVTVQANFTGSDEDDQDSVAISALYSSDFGLDLGIAHTDAQTDETQTTIAAAYSVGDFYGAASYATGDAFNEADEISDMTSIEIALQYKFTKQFRMIGIIAQQEIDDVDTADFYAVEGQYRFNKLIRTYVTYQFNQIDDAEDSLVAGIRYNF
ncbi:porin [Psychromonas sp. 14N.309.X.WAT.B.A12]|uniref:porin n=1 Tax=Psychromonas sp. 14N.309.X.WAT.B.A12 TaxID=2998322 RepID=UPI0025B0E97C|nr:porin [Psychromonas sp. 14N.309.X.WAT.B.A12]MDN2664756.1 porin [Psychromonas sp. 14N.309.X.WAT.B.A12]